MSKPKIIYTSPQGALRNPRSLFDFEIALSAAIETRMTGRIPTPEEAAQKNLAWLQSVSLQSEWLQFHMDQNSDNDPLAAMNGHAKPHG